MTQAKVDEAFALRNFIRGLPETVRVAFFIVSPKPDTLEKAATLAGNVIDGLLEHSDAADSPSFVGAIASRGSRRPPRNQDEPPRQATPKHGRNAARSAKGSSAAGASQQYQTGPRPARDPGPKIEGNCTFCGKKGHTEKFCYSRIDGHPRAKPAGCRAIGQTRLDLNATLFGSPLSVLADSGAEYSFIHSSLLPAGVKLAPSDTLVRAANASPMILEGSVRANLSIAINGNIQTRAIDFLVSNDLETEAILGWNDMGLFEIILDPGLQTAFFKSQLSSSQQGHTLLASMQSNMPLIPAASHAESLVQIPLKRDVTTKFSDIRLQYPLLWSSETNQSRRSTLPALKIELKPDHPRSFKCKSRLNNPRDRAFAIKEIANWKASGIVEASSCTAYQSALIVAWRNEKPRLCLNSIAINAMTLYQPHTPPRVETIRMIVGNASVFSVIDLKLAFLAITLDEESRDLTTFADPDGNLLRFTCMSFGLMDASGHYQSCLEDLLKGIMGVNIYIDDILLFANSVDEMTPLLATVLGRLDGAKLLVNSDKSKFYLSSVPYLGNVLSKSAIRPDPVRIAAIIDLPFPPTTTDLKGFFGTIDIVRPFVPDFGLVKGLLLPLLSKNVAYLPTEAQLTAFTTLKSMVGDAVLLYNPDMAKPVFLRTDASTIGLGAMLYQHDEKGAIRPIQFLSRSLQPGAERNYGAQKLEMLAVKWSLTVLEHWLLGHPDLTVITDHKSLLWCFSESQENATIRRWAAEISRFRPKFEYRSGASNVVADFLSRHPALVDAFQPTDNDDEEVGGVTFPSDIGATSVPASTTTTSVLAVQSASVEPSWRNLTSLRSLQEHDSFCNQVVDASEVGVERIANRCRINGFDIHPTTGILTASIKEGKSTVTVIIAPASITNEVIDHFHKKAHFQFFKVMKQIRKEFFWPTMAADIRARIADCTTCMQRDKAPATPLATGMLSASRPNHLVATDIMGPCPLTARGNSYIITFIDVFTKFAVAIALPDSKATTIAQAFLTNWVAIFDAPAAILSDNGTQYKSALFEEMLVNHKIKHKCTTTYHPAGNGMAERLNRTIQGAIAKLTDDVSDWDSFLSSACLAHNTTVSSTTGFTPFVAMLGRDAPTLVSPTTAPDFQEQVSAAIQLQASTTEAIAAQFAERSRQLINSNEVLVPFAGFKIGDVVVLQNPVYPTGQGQKKFFRPYARAPFRITALHQPNNATIVPLAPSNAKSQRVNISRLKLAVPSMQVMDNSTVDQTPSEPSVASQSESTVTTVAPQPPRSSRSGRAIQTPQRYT